MTNRDKILALLASFAAQRPGLEYGNYGEMRSYRSEMRSITQDLHDFRTLMSAVAWRSSIDEARLRDSFRAFSGRLTLTETADGKMRLDYCTGQYFPTEYRKACCAVLASALWDYVRGECMPAELPNGQSAGDYIRKYFRREFGARIQRKWFD